MPRVVDGDEPLAVLHGVFVLGPFRRPYVAPVASHVALDEGLRIFLGFKQGHEGLRGEDYPPYTESGNHNLLHTPPFASVVEGLESE